MSILFDFEDAINQSERIEEYAASIRKSANSDIGSVLSNLNSGWTGDAAQAYKKKLMNEQSSIVKNSSELEQIGRELARIARNFQKVEESAAGIFDIRW